MLLASSKTENCTIRLEPIFYLSTTFLRERDQRLTVSDGSIDPYYAGAGGAGTGAEESSFPASPSDETLLASYCSTPLFVKTLQLCEQCIVADIGSVCMALTTHCQLKMWTRVALATKTWVHVTYVMEILLTYTYKHAMRV